MDPIVRNAIARVEVRRDGAIVSLGTATLVGENRVLTALHVVGDRHADRPPCRTCEIWLTFPTHSTTATVLEGKWDARDDWALLSCTTPPPKDIRPLPLARVARDDDRWETYGFPEAQASDGMVCKGTVENHKGMLDGAPVHQLFCRQAAAGDGMPVKGLSGAPVVVAGAVIGVLRFALWTERLDVDGQISNVSRAGTIYACPATHIAAALPEHFPERLPTVSSTRSETWQFAAAAIVSAVCVAGYFVARPLRTPDPNQPLVAWLDAHAIVPPVNTAGLPAQPSSVDLLKKVDEVLAQGAPHVNQEIVIDTSMGMGDTFVDGSEKTTKLAAAVAALQSVTPIKEDNLALRVFGGDCDQDDRSRKLVEFGTNRQNEIRLAAQDLRPRGQPPLVFGVVSAITDMASLHNARRIVVLTGGDKCPNESLSAIDDRLTLAHMDARALDIRLIGLGVSPERKKTLEEIGKRVRGEVHVANNFAQLNEVLKFVLILEPAVKQVQDVWNVVEQVAKGLNDLKDLTNAGKFSEGQDLLDAVQTSYRNSKQQFEGADKGELSVSFLRFYKLAARNRSLQEQGLRIGRDWIRYGKSPGVESPEYAAAVGKWNAISVEYNNNVGEMNRLTNVLRDEAMKRRATVGR